MLGRLILMATGLILGCGLAVAFLPLAILSDPVTRAAGAAFWLHGLFEAGATLGPGTPGEVALFGEALATGLFAICVLPLLLIVLIGEAARTRSLVWYSGATGVLAAAMPAILRAGLHRPAIAAADRVEARFLLLFFLTGIVSGGLYWLIAGRAAMRSQPRPKVSSNE